MAKVVITIEDTPDGGVEVSAEFDPDLPEEWNEDDLTEAQLFALATLESMELEGEEEEED
ncbi:MAG: hypothetical protein LDL07_10400 [Desulfarculus sp.]|jgi:hypothetical protein|nr:hypothetical protein [Desulfarculus sp.]